jgi:hypothetical protein
MRDWLGFAGVSPPSVPVIQSEQQFAEKLHAYALPRTGVPNSRVRNLVDMVLPIRSRTLEWSAPLARLAAECRLDLSASEAFQILAEFYADLR